jgi:hypothetical protein
MTLLLWAVAGLAQADSISQCVDGAGRITWSNQGCRPEERVSQLEVQPAVVDSSGLRDWAKRNPPRSVAKAETRAQKPEKFINSIDCENARRAYAFELGGRHRKADQVAYRRKEVCRSCGECP